LKDDLDQLCLLPAHRQLQLFREKRVSPVEILKAQIARIESGGKTINAFTYRHFDEALDGAREAEARYQRGNSRPLEGITVAVKDEYSKVGWTVTEGSCVYKDSMKKDNHPVIDKLIEAGAVLHVQTTAPELYLVAVTWSDLWGVTRNPWNPEITPGGSSGGSAAALAGCMTTLAIGSDMGGSIRIPCALNGLYGSKPAYGRIASPDPSALVPHASPGPLARNVHDLIVLQNVMSGPAPGCPAVLRPKLEIPSEYQRNSRKLALSLDQGWARLEPDVRANTLAAARLLEKAGYEVEEVDLVLETSDGQLRETIEKALFSTALGAELIELASQSHHLTTYGRRFVELASVMGPTQAKEAAEEALRLYRIIDRDIFGAGYDALITPTVATTRIKADYDPTTDVPIIQGGRVDPYSGWFMTSLFSLLNWMPVINVPSGIASNSVPTGLQIATQPYDDITGFEIAAAYAEVAPGMPFQTLSFD
jgi:Asp-tRNA(Asn)/Glu-tRNA(Gln) amidotransferase A subunit family amidase